MQTQKKQYYVEVGGILNGVVLESINSNAVTVNVNLPKISINKEPTDKTINLWESNLATFSAVASISDSKAILNYQRYQNGNLIHGATKSSYTVPRSELLAGATKSYYVRVGGTLNGVALESIDSNVVNLKINPLPIISINKQPTDKTVISWTPNLPTFSVAVNNIKDAQLNYQWFWGTPDPKDPWYKIEGATSSSYTVNSSDVLIPGTIKHYYVRVSGTIHGIPLVSLNSGVATLRVNDTPKITISSQPQNTKFYIGKLGQNAPSFSVVAATNIPNTALKYQWYQNESNTTVGATMIAGANSSSYTVPESDLWSGTWGPRNIYYYVKVSGSFNGIEITPVFSGIAVLNITRYM